MFLVPLTLHPFGIPKRLGLSVCPSKCLDTLTLQSSLLLQQAAARFPIACSPLPPIGSLRVREGAMCPRYPCLLCGQASPFCSFSWRTQRDIPSRHLVDDTLTLQVDKERKTHFSAAHIQRILWSHEHRAVNKAEVPSLPPEPL